MSPEQAPIAFNGVGIPSCQFFIQNLRIGFGIYVILLVPTTLRLHIQVIGRQHQISARFRQNIEVVDKRTRELYIVKEPN